jgi:hypothetical protein
VEVSSGGLWYYRCWTLGVIIENISVGRSRSFHHLPLLICSATPRYSLNLLTYRLIVSGRKENMLASGWGVMTLTSQMKCPGVYSLSGYHVFSSLRYARNCDKIFSKLSDTTSLFWFSPNTRQFFISLVSSFWKKRAYEITMLSVCLCIPPINFW